MLTRAGPLPLAEKKHVCDRHLQASRLPVMQELVVWAPRGEPLLVPKTASASKHVVEAQADSNFGPPIHNLVV